MPSEWNLEERTFVRYTVSFSCVWSTLTCYPPMWIIRPMGQFASIFCTFSFVLSVPLFLMNGGTLMTNNAWGMEHFLIEQR